MIFTTKYIHLYLAILVLLSFSACQKNEFELKAGDLLFQKWDSSDFAKAINKVTEGYNNHDFAHVGMVVHHEEELKVFESTVAMGVNLTPVSDFLFASVDSISGKPLVAVGRLQDKYTENLSAINEWLLNELAKPYDTLFIYGNDKYYCSELIHDAFNKNSGDQIFELKPMTFKDPDTNEFFPIRVEYFNEHKAEIPENQPGINPGLMSRSTEIKIVHEYFNQ